MVRMSPWLVSLSFTVIACCLLMSAVRAAEDGKTMVNSIGMRLVRIEPGQFTMGSPSGGDFDERPVHPVRITRPFFMGATEVTNAQYEQFDPEHRKLRGRLGFSTKDDEAVIFVSWHDAERFCHWLADKEGKPYRLPTEAEWEYAARAGTTTAYSTGDTLPTEYHKHQKTERTFIPVGLRNRADAGQRLGPARHARQRRGVVLSTGTARTCPTSKPTRSAGRTATSTSPAAAAIRPRSSSSARRTGWARCRRTRAT